MLKDPITQKPHTAMWPTIVGGAIAGICLIGIILGKLPIELLFTFVAPLLGFGAMARRG